MRRRRALDVDAPPSVLGVRFGVNPNSSSLGVDVTYLMLGGTFALLTSLALGAWLRGWGRTRGLDVVGEADEQS